MMILYMWIVYVSVVKAKQTYVNTFSADRTWQYSNSYCTLAVPNITYMHDEILATVDTTGLQRGDKAWLGYVQSFKIFQYIGCGNITHLSTRRRFVMQSDLGNCFSACNDKYFGIQRFNGSSYMGECYCLGDSVQADSYINLFSTQCRQVCFIPEGTSCGGVGYISIYEEVLDTGLENVLSSKQVCGAYNIKDAEWKWKSCSRRSLFICDKEYLTANAECTVNKDEQVDNWSTSSYKCFIDKKYPAKYNAKFVKTQTPSPMYNGDVWTGLLRSYVVEKKKEISSTTLFGYIEVKSDDKYLVRFTKEDETLGKALCINGNIQPTTSTFSQYTETSSHGNIQPTTSTFSQYTETSSHGNMQTTASTFLPYTETSSRAGIYIGIVVAVLVLAGGVLGFVCWRQCKTQPSENKTPIRNDIDNSADNDESSMYATSDENHTYDYGVAMDIDVMKAANRDEGTYDTTASVSKVVTVAVTTENAYSTLGTTDDTYSHTITYQKNKTKVLTSPRRIDENEYDTCNNIQKETVAIKPTDASASEYSHISFTRNTSKQTDNVYAKSNVGINNRCDRGDAEYEVTDNSTM